MFPLVALPREILSSILGSSGLGASVIKLWKCGDKKLHERLRKNVEINVHLESINRLPKSRFPKALFALSLTTLTIYSPGFEFQSPRDMSNLLRQLPNCLETLVVNVPSKNTCFIDFSRFPASVTRAPESLAEEPLKAHIWNIGEVFPHLKTLKLPFSGIGDELSFQYLWSDADLELLPDSLTFLEVRYDSSRIQRAALNTMVLPRGLKSFDTMGAPQFFQSLSQAQNLPRTLEYLRVDESDYNFSSFELMKALPKSLTQLDMQMRLELPSLAQLPNLTTIIVNDLPLELYAQAERLFPNLKSLDYYGGMKAPADLILTLALPNSVTSLKIPAVRSFEGVKWPSKLEELSIEEAGLLCEDTCLALPPITKLELHGGHVHGDFRTANLKFLPKSILSLHLQGATDLCEGQEISGGSQHGSRAGSQHGSRAGSENGEDDEDTVTAGFVPAKDHFPPNLTSLEAQRYRMHLECLSNLPDSLLTLRAQIREPLSASVAKRLPAGLTSLDLDHSSIVNVEALPELPSSISMLSIRQINFPEVLKTPTNFSVPASLTQLTVDRVSPSDPPEGVSLLLPDSVTDLYLPVPSFAYFHMLPYLPPSLKTLFLGLDRRRDRQPPTKEMFADLVRAWSSGSPSAKASLERLGSAADFEAIFMEILPSSLYSIILPTDFGTERDLAEDFHHRRLLLHTPDRRVLNELKGTDLELEYYELPRSAKRTMRC